MVLDRGDVGIRVDRVLLRHLHDIPGISRTRIQRWIDAGDVRLNGGPIPRAAWRVAAGDEIAVRLTEARERTRMRPEPTPLHILYEDEWLLAVDKPAGVVVHPSYGHATGTLMNALLARVERPSLIHRLDKHTSGVVLVARTPQVHRALQAQLHARRIDKDYLAVVWGRVTPARGTIDLALDRDPWDRRRVQVRDRGGQPSVTRYERLCTWPARKATAAQASLSLLRCRLVTGRMHQIRVHLAHKGWPLVGDPTYGDPPRARLADPVLDALARGFPRQALHAWRLALLHPVTRAALAIESPVPSDLRLLMDAAGLQAPPRASLDATVATRE
ncbi:MAG: RluA family pseudouridine synthase [Acidobacteriota bacterium]